MKIAGIHVQEPWSQLLLAGTKTIETRSYPLPSHYLNVPLAIIETHPGSGPKRKKAMIVGVIVFETCFEYRNKSQWKSDISKHNVDEGDTNFAFGQRKRTFGWVVKSALQLKNPCKPPSKRGITFVSDCQITQLNLPHQPGQ